MTLRTQNIKTINTQFSSLLFKNYYTNEPSDLFYAGIFRTKLLFPHSELKFVWEALDSRLDSKFCESNFILV
jgi:hypothetical protein